MKSRIINILKFLIGWPLSIIALYFIYSTFSSQIGQLSLIEHINYWSLLTGTLCFISYYFLRSFVWLKLIHFLGHSMSFRESNYLWLFAQLKRYIPGNIWSYLGLAVTYNERNVSKKDIAYAVWIESEVVIIVTFILSLLAVPFVMTYFIKVPLETTQVSYVLTGVFLFGAVIYIFLGKWLKKGSGKFMTITRHVFSKFTPQQNTALLSLMGFSYILYGLGYYFSISAIFPLNPEYILTYIGIFIFSLVAGFLSLVTPTGLGVREGFITLGLSKFMPVGAAGFSAIFSRIIIVIAELITLGLSYAWYKAGKRMGKYETLLARHTHEVLLILAVLLYTVYFTLISFLRYSQYYTGRFDLGNMAQTVWNTSQGKFFLLTDPNGTAIVSRLAFHADFILVFLTPFYWLWSDPRMLLLIQTVVVAAGAFFVYGISRHVLKEKTISLIIAIAFLLNPSVQRANIYDFHAVVLATTFLLGAVYFLLKKRYGWFLLFAILAAFTKEQLWFIVALFGPILFFVYKKRLFGVTLFITALGVFYYMLWHAIPTASGSAHFALSYFAEGGDSPTDIIKHIIFSPGDSLKTAFAENRVDYYKKLLLPTGFLPVFYPLWLIMAAPDLVLNIFSDRAQLQQIYYQYTATISSFLFLSLIYAVSLLRKYLPKIPLTIFSAYILCAAVLGAYLYGPLPGSKEPNIAMITRPQPEKASIDTSLQQIPRDASVSASNNLASHLSHRERIYVVPNGIGLAEYVAIFKTPNNTNDKDALALERVSADLTYEKYSENSQIVLFRKIQRAQ